jgi:hypothetical protein
MPLILELEIQEYSDEITIGGYFGRELLVSFILLFNEQVHE